MTIVTVAPEIKYIIKRKNDERATSNKSEDPRARSKSVK